MPYRWPADTDFAPWELDVLDRNCPVCGRMMHICDHRYRHFHTLDGPVELICKLNHCPDPPVPGTPRPRAPSSKSPSPCPSWRSAGTSSAGSDIDAVLGTWRSPRSDPNSWTTTGSSSPKTPSASTSDVTRSCSRRASKTPSPSAGNTNRSTEIILSHRRPPAREGTRDPLRRAGADPEAGLVRRAVALRDRGRGPTPDHEGQGVGRIPGQAGGAVDVGQAGRVRHGDRGGIPRRAAPLLRQPLPPRCGQARPGGRQPCQGPDAEEGARPAEDRTGRAPAAGCRGAEGRRRTDAEATVDGDRRAGGRRLPAGRSRRLRGARLLRGGARDPQ